MPSRTVTLTVGAALAAILFIGTTLGQQPPIPIRPTAQGEIILATPDVQPKLQSQAAELGEALRTFNQVLSDDLRFSGFFTMAGKSFYPPQPIVRPEEINYDAWSVLPFRVSFLSAGTLELQGGIVRAEVRLMDMKQRTLAFGQNIQGDVDQVRAMAHRWADDIVYKLTAGASRGIASTKIAYTSRRGDAKEIYVMDYDGFSPRAFTHNGSTNLFPAWGPDNAKLAFVSLRTGSWEINVHNNVDGSRIPFPIFGSFASTPAISPDGNQIVFSMRTPRGDTDLFISGLDGSGRRNVTNHPAIDTSPTWAPSGKQIAFVSSRDGAGQIYVADADGANVRRIVKEGGDADSPSWSPDGRLLAFHWKPHRAEHYDIFVAEVASGRISQITSGTGSNESPSWAPDGRHLAFQSTRNGGSQIFIMLADGTEVRMVTTQGVNTSPAWGAYTRRD